MPRVTRHTFVFTLLLIVLGFSFFRALVARPMSCQGVLIFFHVFLHLPLAMGQTKRCPGCNITQAEHTFGKLDKKCSWPVQDDVPELSNEGDTARQEQDASSQDTSFQATLNSLLGGIKSLAAGLDEVKADNKNLTALVEKKKAADGTSVLPPTLSDGDDVA